MYRFFGFVRPPFARVRWRRARRTRNKTQLWNPLPVLVIVLPLSPSPTGLHEFGKPWLSGKYGQHNATRKDARAATVKSQPGPSKTRQQLLPLVGVVVDQIDSPYPGVAVVAASKVQLAAPISERAGHRAAVF